MLHYENYGPYAEGLKNGKIIVKVPEIDKNNYEYYYQSLVNILKDAIETDLVQNTFIEVWFDDSFYIELSFFDYLFTLIMWNILIATDITIEPKHLFFKENITAGSIKNYIDTFFIDANRKKFENIELNNIIDDMMHKWVAIDDFDMYLLNTINLEDDIKLMEENVDVYDIFHKDFSDIALEDVKNVGTECTNRLINVIKNSDHCLADAFKAEEGVNKKQYREYAVNIGTKPDGQGGVFPDKINNSYINGGINNLLSSLIDSSTGRTAQILSKKNVSTSGHFARLLRSNNMDTWLHYDPEYKCNTKNLQLVYIKDRKMLNMLNNRYYKLSKDGMDHLIKSKSDGHLIGQSILLYSPMTCASKANGYGICYRCYGDLAHTNADINVGVMAAEILSDPLTQKLLSAKHLLESLIKKITWTEGFNEIFDITSNVIKLVEDVNFKGYKLLIDPEAIHLEEEDDDQMYNEFINEFEIEYPDGNIKKFYTSENDDIYLSTDLNNIIRSKAEPVDGMISINLNDLKGSDIFLVQVQNNELSKTLNEIKAIINKDAVTRNFNRHTILQTFIEAVNEGGLNVDSIHLEVILSNQIRAVDDILECPEWEYPDEPYEILTLNRALSYNPSPIITLTYEKIGKALYNPLTFKKNKASYLDLFFLENPAEFISASEIIPSKDKKNDGKIVSGIIYDEENNDE